MSAPANPCMRVCRIHEDTLYCLGCGRTREEIAHWFYLPESERGAASADLPRRLALNRRHPEQAA